MFGVDMGPLDDIVDSAGNAFSGFFDKFKDVAGGMFGGIKNIFGKFLGGGGGGGGDIDWVTYGLIAIGIILLVVVLKKILF